MKNFAVVLSGCGVYDGAEIHESTLSLLAIAKNGGSYKIFAPDIEQHHVINHITGEEINEMIKANKPIGALCISPVLIAKSAEGAENVVKAMIDLMDTK